MSATQWAQVIAALAVIIPVLSTAIVAIIKAFQSDAKAKTAQELAGHATITSDTRFTEVLQRVAALEATVKAQNGHSGP